MGLRLDRRILPSTTPDSRAVVEASPVGIVVKYIIRSGLHVPQVSFD